MSTSGFRTEILGITRIQNSLELVQRDVAREVEQAEAGPGPPNIQGDGSRDLVTMEETWTEISPAISRHDTAESVANRVRTLCILYTIYTIYIYYIPINPCVFN